MRTRVLFVATVSFLVAPVVLEAQGIGVGLRGGTIGIGAEGAVAVSPNIAFRGGIGLLPLEIEPTIDDVDYTLELPDTWLNLGIDVYLVGPLRVGGGILIKPDDPFATAQVASGVTANIGGVDYTGAELGTLTATLVSKTSAPYLLVGFGRHTSTGFGMFLDLGLAFLGEPDFELESVGGIVSELPDFQSRLRQEEINLQEDAASWLKYWPILNVGFRFGIG